MKTYNRDCHECGESFCTSNRKRKYCYRRICNETANLIEQAIDHLSRVITEHIITSKTAKNNLKNKKNLLINRKNSYLTIKNLPKKHNGITRQV